MRAALVQRAIGGVLAALVGWQAGSLVGRGAEQPRNAILGILVGGLAGIALAPYIVSKPHAALKSLVGSMPAVDLISAVLGLILGLIVSALLSYPLSFLPWWLGHVLPALAAIICAYLGISFALMRRREIARFLHLRTESSEESSSGSILVDTSAIIDGRIADITQTGFLQGTLLVPRFVLRELQHIADSPDPLRRNRGRRGLDILNRLQKDPLTPVEISDSDPRDVPDVDGKLVKLARQLGAPVVTNDFNLNRVAELQGVKVLNINQLANSLKPFVLPGEEMAVHILQEGKEFNQGVAYLDDGTMVVVENGRQHIHKDVDIVVTRVLQTVAGRMIFAQPKMSRE